jgi:hypothetical protein
VPDLFFAEPSEANDHEQLQAPAPGRPVAASVGTSSRRGGAARRECAAGGARQRLAAPIPAPAAPLPGVLEFHADAGALEGALYVDGELVGYLPGVRRL